MLLVLQVVAACCWIAWRAQPSLSNRALRQVLEENGATVSSRESWRIGEVEYGPITIVSFEDQALTDEQLLGLREPLLSFDRLELDLTGTRVSDTGLEALAGNKGLVAINFYGTRVTDRGFGALASCPALIQINLNRTGVSGESFEQLRTLPALRSLQLWGTRVTDSAIPGLLELTTLRELVLNDTGISPDGLSKLKQGLPETRISPDPP